MIFQHICWKESFLWVKFTKHGLFITCYNCLWWERSYLVLTKMDSFCKLKWFFFQGIVLTMYIINLYILNHILKKKRKLYSSVLYLYVRGVTAHLEAGFGFSKFSFIWCILRWTVLLATPYSCQWISPVYTPGLNTKCTMD